MDLWQYLVLFSIVTGYSFVDSGVLGRPSEANNEVLDDDDFLYRIVQYENSKEYSCNNGAKPLLFVTTCYYSFKYRSKGPRYCNHFMLFGQNKKGKELLEGQYYEKPKVTNGENKDPVEIDVKYPTDDDVNYVPISMITVEDSDSSERIRDDKICITKGGINEKSVEMIIESNNVGNSRGYNVTIYGNLS